MLSKICVIHKGMSSVHMIYILDSMLMMSEHGSRRANECQHFMKSMTHFDLKVVVIDFYSCFRVCLFFTAIHYDVKVIIFEQILQCMLAVCYI